MRLLQSLSTGPVLGIRFWDETLDQQVRDGLTVTARLAEGSGRLIPAFQTGNGIYVFRSLPGWPAPDDETPAPAIVIEARDGLDRFLPVAIKQTPGETSTQLFPPGGFYLFSAPTRPARPGLAAIQGQLWDRTADGPAAWAVLEVMDPEGKSWYGMTDERGCIGLLFPYPPIPGALLSESPPGPVTPVRQYQWSLALRVRYGADPPAPPPGALIPDLAAILSQPYGTLAADPDEPGSDELTAWLTFGQELVLRTGGLSRLLIDPGEPTP